MTRRPGVDHQETGTTMKLSMLIHRRDHKGFPPSNSGIQETLHPLVPAHIQTFGR